MLDLNDLTVEPPETVMARVRRALPYVPPGRLVLAPDCGMKYLPRDVAFGKLTALTAAAARLRAEVPAPRGGTESQADQSHVVRNPSHRADRESTIVW